MNIFKIAFWSLFLCCFLFRNIYSQAETDKILTQANSSDVIIIGEVENIKDMPAPSSEMFHSMIQIQIDSLIKGKINFEEVIIRQQSGPITDYVHEGTRIEWSDEPELVIGHRYVFFLKKPRK